MLACSSRRLLLAALLVCCCGLACAQMMDMGGSPAGSLTVPMLPESTAPDSHPTSVVLDWNAILRSLARGTTFGLWPFEDPDAGNTTSRFGTFLSPPMPPAAAARTFALMNIAMREALSPLLHPGAPGALVGPGWGGATAAELLDAVSFPGAAATFAAHYVLSHLYPSRKQAMFDAAAPGWDGVLARHLSAPGYGLTGAWANTGAVAAAQRVGVASGRLAVQLAAADGFDIYMPWAPNATAAAAAAAAPRGAPPGGAALRGGEAAGDANPAFRFVPVDHRVVPQPRLLARALACADEAAP